MTDKKFNDIDTWRGSTFETPERSAFDPFGFNQKESEEDVFEESQTDLSSNLKISWKDPTEVAPMPNYRAQCYKTSYSRNL